MAVPSGKQLHRVATSVLSLAMIVIGAVMVVSTLARGGGPLTIGVVIGILFAAAGSARLYLHTR